jgi:hypothetical protein
MVAVQLPLARRGVFPRGTTEVRGAVYCVATAISLQSQMPGGCYCIFSVVLYRRSFSAKVAACIEHAAPRNVRLNVLLVEQPRQSTRSASIISRNQSISVAVRRAPSAKVLTESVFTMVVELALEGVLSIVLSVHAFTFLLDEYIVQPRTRLSTDTKKLGNYQAPRRQRSREAKGYHRNTHHVEERRIETWDVKTVQELSQKCPTRLSNRVAASMQDTG